jgi:phage tail-like protein
MSIGPVAVFNFRVLFSAAVQENTGLEFGDAVAAAVGQAQLVVPAAAASGIRAGFAEVSGLNSELEMEEYREGGRNIGPRRFPKWGRYPNLIMRRGVTQDTALWDWWAQVITQSYTRQTTLAPPRRSGVIILEGPDHTAIAGWFFSNALPERLVGPGLNARSNEIAIETLELSHEGLLRLNTLPQGV